MGKSDSNIVIFNSSPIINLSKINSLDLIKKIYKQILIPKAVYNEVVIKGTNRDNIYKIEELISTQTIKIATVNNQEIIKVFAKDLDYGESEVLALALQLNADLVVIDETDARNIADIYNLNKTGFIGILIKAQEVGYTDSVIRYLDLAIQKGFRINSKLYDYLNERFD